MNGGTILGSYAGPDPNDLSDQYNTPLTDEEERKFQLWRSRLPARLQYMGDYDLRGAWKANAKEAANGHLPDTWKKPNHMTFSSGSMYSGQNGVGVGGGWEDAAPGYRGDPARHPWTYWATPANLQYHDVLGLGDYFKQNERSSAVVLPIQYSLPGRR